jgi:hypothetical protein
MGEFMQQGITIMSDVQCKTLIKLYKAIQQRSGMLTYSIVLLHDNARPHTAARNRVLQEHLNWELFDHPPHNPLLAPVYVPEEVGAITSLQQ